MTSVQQTVYIETSIVSYLTARPSRDLITVANQQITNEWWENYRHQFNLYTSLAVLDEANQGDKQAAEKRLKVLQSIPLLLFRPEVLDLANEFMRQKALPQKADEDAAHIAIATIYRLDYLLTWNCKHIANAQIQKKMAKISTEKGYDLPTICTPTELMGDLKDVD